MALFDRDVIDAVTQHMNDDHTDDTLVILRAFARPDITEATMTGLDESGGDWQVVLADGSEQVVRVDWPIPVEERRDIRRAVVELYDEACTRLGHAD